MNESVRNCLECDEPFTVDAADWRTRKRLFCSGRCRHRWWRHRHIEEQNQKALTLIGKMKGKVPR